MLTNATALKIHIIISMKNELSLLLDNLEKPSYLSRPTMYVSGSVFEVTGHKPYMCRGTGKCMFRVRNSVLSVFKTIFKAGAFEYIARWRFGVQFFFTLPRF